ncbi:hypothetical protein HRH25_18520 [Flavisolibacter sp. BT320]|nr:hypothetical protein [Flavisolibacter longurius]
MSKIIIDPELGKLEFQDVEGMLSYNCKLTLPVSTKQVEVFFETDSVENLPTKAQKRFLQHLVEQYNTVIGSIASNLPNEVEITGDKCQELKEKFYLDTVGIPVYVEGEAKWDLSLVSRQVKSMSLLANFAGMRPIKVWVEQAPKRPLLLKLLLKMAGR